MKLHKYFLKEIEKQLDCKVIFSMFNGGCAGVLVKKNGVQLYDWIWSEDVSEEHNCEDDVDSHLEELLQMDEEWHVFRHKLTGTLIADMEDISSRCGHTADDDIFWHKFAAKVKKVLV